jgi:hypothetical protein
VGLRHPAFALLALLLVTGCGDSAPQARRPPARRPAPAAGSPEARVIARWADTLRAGDARAAARLFAVPATVANGEPPRRLTTAAQVVAFNESLPCGARLVRTRRRGRYTVATFRLTERRGGDCGLGVGDIAATAFRLRRGKIVEWLRVPTSSEPAPPPPGSQTS